MVIESEKKRTVIRDNGHWGACEPCARLVRLRRMAELADRSFALAAPDVKESASLEFMALLQQQLFWPGFHGYEHPLTDHPKETLQ